MNDRITSSGELRQFASDNTGRRKIDVEHSLELHRRSAAVIDSLNEEIAGLKRALASATDGSTSAPTLSNEPAEDPTEAALLILRQAQATADQTLAEAQEVRAQADRTKAEAEALAQAKAEAAISQARGECAHLIEQAEARAAEVAASTAVEADRAAFAQRQFRDRAAALRADAASIVNLAESMETAASEDLPPSLTRQPFTEPTMTGEVAPVSNLAPPTAQPAPPAPEENLPPVPPTHSLPPPPDQELLEMNDNELEEAIGASIDDELFGEEPVIDLTDDGDTTPAPAAGNFEFFSRDR